MNASFGAEDGLQLLHMVVDGSRYESASIFEAAELLANYSLINYARLDNLLDKGKGKGLRPV